MLMLDNSGSMNNVVVETPYDPNTTYSTVNATTNATTSCSGTNLVPTGTSVDISIVSSQPRIRYSGTTYTFGNSGSGARCFAKTATYGARLNADAGTAPSGYLDAEYTGNYLNWYFNSMNTTPNWNSGQKTKPGTLSRMTITKDAAKTLVGGLANIRLGLSTYNSGDGGSLREIIGDINATKISNTKTKIDALNASGATPLAETLSDIGRYFTTGYSGNLTLHPDNSPSTASVSDIFKQGSTGSHNLSNNSGQTIVNPIEHACQKSFAVLMTDGRPQSDRAISDKLRDYTGDCATGGLCDAAGTTVNMPGTAIANAGSTTTCDNSNKNWRACKNGSKVGRTYESQGSDYLDDVAKGLYEMDLRPDLVDANGAKNNLTTYTIGFADTTVANDPLLTDSANVGGGEYFSADDSTELQASLQAAFAAITNNSSSSSSVAANSTQFKSGALLYQALFNPSGWDGDVKAIDLLTEDLDGNGVLTPNSSEDANNNGKLDVGIIGGVRWNAAQKIPAEPPVAQPERKIFSYNPENVASSKGIDFKWTQLNSTQKTVLDVANIAQPSSPILDFLRGNRSEEGPATTKKFRERNTVLGDIINSDPLYVADQDFGYGTSSLPEAGTYNAFKANKSNNAEMLYIGANDGMLHAIDASATGANAGVEQFAYVPNAVISPELVSLTDENYVHKYFVDGPPQAGDVFFGGGWHTVLVGSMGAGSTTTSANISAIPALANGAGGRAIFALDITTPGSFDQSKVMWEFSNRKDTALPAATVQELVDEDLGYTIPVPSVTRIKYNGKWAVVVANGYRSTDGEAVLYILDIETGAIIHKFTVDSPVGKDNGLSTPTPVDVDDDKITDYIYAGDLKGNLWKFDVTDGTDPNNWTSLRLFVACTTNATPCSTTDLQPITAKPTVTKAKATEQNSGQMIYFGTGKYFEDGDHTSTGSQKQTFYGIWDECDKVFVCNTAVSGRSVLLEQKITHEFINGTTLAGGVVVDQSVRVTSACEVAFGATAPSTVPSGCSNATNRKGWFMDLVPPSGTIEGERVVNTTIVRNDTVIFTTLIPITVPCSAAGGTGWLMEVGLSGARFLGSNIDINRDGKIDDNDLIKLDDGTTVAATGLGSKVGIIDAPVIIDTGDEDTKYLNGNLVEGSNFGIMDVKENPQGGCAAPPCGGGGGGVGIRRSWRQLR